MAVGGEGEGEEGKGGRQGGGEWHMGDYVHFQLATKAEMPV